MTNLERANAMMRQIRSLPREVVDWGAEGMHEGVPALNWILERWFPGRTDLKILELGTCRCVGASLMSVHGTVYTSDPNTYDGTDAVLRTLGTRDRIVQLRGPQAQTRELLGKVRFDVAFIDAEHKFDPVMADFRYCESVAGAVIFHDYSDRFPGVVQAVDQIRNRVGGEWVLFNKFAAWRGRGSNVG